MTLARHLFQSSLERLWEARFARFLIVGVVNTAFGYGVFFALLHVGAPPTPALAGATIVGVAFNFVTTGALVFANGDAWRLWRFVGVYGLVFAIDAFLLDVALRLRFEPALAQAALLPACVVLSYLLNRNFVFNRAAQEASS